ncbi:MAG: cytochrome c oxidase assembly protein, partial [Lysinibacillus sp.]
TKYARYLTKFLKSTYVKVITHPALATAQNILAPYGLYTMGLYSYMHGNDVVYFIIHLHIFLAAYLFTISIIYIDPVFHRYSFRIRAIALIIGIAGHSVIAKWIYIQPPLGVTPEHAKTGAYLMYYGGDLIEAVLIFALCWQWYKATGKYSVSVKSNNY